jgi:hypothetical protein
MKPQVAPADLELHHPAAEIFKFIPIFTFLRGREENALWMPLRLDADPPKSLEDYSRWHQ